MMRAQNSQGELLSLGATSYVPGDITLPAARPAGAAPTAQPTSREGITFDDATRRRCFDATTRILENLHLYPQDLVLVNEINPSGIIQAIIGGIIGVGIIGAGIYATYRAHVDAQVGVALAEANARTEQVRIQQRTWAAAQAAEQQARLQAYAMQLAYAQKMRSFPPLPAWASESPITVPQPGLPPSGGGSSGWSIGQIVAALLGGTAVVGGSLYYASSKLSPEHREIIRRRASNAVASLRGQKVE